MGACCSSEPKKVREKPEKDLPQASSEAKRAEDFAVLSPDKAASLKLGPAPPGDAVEPEASSSTIVLPPRRLANGPSPRLRFPPAGPGPELTAAVTPVTSTYSNYLTRNVYKKTHSVTKCTLEDGTLQVNNYTLSLQTERPGVSATYRGVSGSQAFQVHAYTLSALRKRCLAPGQKALARVRAEVELLAKLQHPHLQNLVETIESPYHSKFYVVLEFAERVQVPYSECKAQGLFRQLLAAVEYLHKVALLAHTRVCPQNLRLAENGQLKLAGLATCVPIVNGRLGYVP